MKSKIKFIVVSFIIISSIYMMNTSKSRYFSQISFKSDIEVAIPQIELENVAYTTDVMFPGDTKIVNFNVRNFNNSEINEVLMQYYITLDFQKDSIPFNYEIYQINGANDIKLNETAKGFGPINLNYGQEETTYFKLICSWKETDNEVIYADKQVAFKIVVNAEQVI